METSLDRLEKQHGLTTKQCAALLGLNYIRYMEFKRGTRELKPYHEASVKAHMLLPKAQVKKLVTTGE